MGVLQPHMALRVYTLQGHIHTSTATAVSQREQAGIDRHNQGINWKCFQVSLTELLDYT